MTAEVAVLNREAAAIAADSEATLQSGNRVDDKVYNSANKIFELSAVEPIGIMIHGTGTFGIVPWETIIKTFRKQLGIESYNTVAEYAMAFIEHLHTYEDYFPMDYQILSAKKTVEKEINAQSSLLHAIETSTSVSGISMSSAQRRLRLLTSIQHRISELEDAICIDPLSEADARELLSETFTDWPSYLQNQFDSITVDEEIVETATTLAVKSFMTVSLMRLASGILVVGFGKDQVFPAWSHYAIESMIAGKHRVCNLENLEINNTRFVDIRGFAQDDTTLAFLNGMHPRYPPALQGLVDETLRNFVRELEEHLDPTMLPDNYDDFFDSIENIRLNTRNNFVTALDTLLAKRHRQPFESIVSSLPKEELADIAETLVSLTSFQQRMTPGLESVGGPVDVALISKGDGLIWIRRKHYFDKQLNMRYFERNRL